MLILRVCSGYGAAEIPKLLEHSEAIAIKLDAIHALEEVELAEYLAKKAFKNKTNIANKFKYEFLLWLTGKRDIKSAVEETKSDGNEFYIIIFSGNGSELLKELNVKKLELGLSKKAEPLQLERISLSRLK
ncbi:MAG: KEOPS complex subunit Cgi121 [Candidatus Micrarchaeota archaeon]